MYNAKFIAKLNLSFPYDEMTYNQTIQKFISNGSLIRWPKKYKEQLGVIMYAAEKIDRGTTYTEKAINELLKAFYAADYILIRRSLVDFGFLKRTSDCSVYEKGEI